MVTVEEVRHAKKELMFFVGNEDWFRGIGIGALNGGPCIRVYAAEDTPAVREMVPEVYLGVPVALIIVGEIVPYSTN